MSIRIMANQKYKPDGIVIGEMMACVVGVALLFTSWMVLKGVNFDDEMFTQFSPSIIDTASDAKGPGIYFIVGSLILCFVLKFFMRATWMSAITALFYGSQIYAVFAAIQDVRHRANITGTIEDMTDMTGEPTVWCFLAIVVEFVFICSVFVGIANWISTATRQRAKKLFVVAFTLLGVGVAGKLMSLVTSEGNALITFNLIFIYSLIAALVCAVLGLICWLRNNKEKVETFEQADSENVKEVSEPTDSITPGVFEVNAYGISPSRKRRAGGIRPWHYGLVISMLVAVLIAILLPALLKDNIPQDNTSEYNNADLNINSEASDTMSTEVVKNTQVVTGYSISEKGRFTYELTAKMNDKMVKTEISWDQALGVDITETADFDADGNMDAIIVGTNGGSAGGEFCQLCFYNGDKRVFQSIDIPFAPSLEKWNGRTTLTDRGGLSMTRYVLETGKLKKVEEKQANVGKSIWHRTREGMFPVVNEVSDDQEAWFDLDSDGEDDKIVFGHNDSHALNWGRAMCIQRIECSSGTTLGDNYFGLYSGESFTILDHKTNGWHDFIIDDHLFRWNGSGMFERWEFDGKQLRKEKS